MIIINIYFFLDCIRPTETITSRQYERSVRNVIQQLQDEFDPTEDNWAQMFPTETLEKKKIRLIAYEESFINDDAKVEL